MKPSLLIFFLCLLLTGCDASTQNNQPEGTFQLRGLEGEKIVYVDDQTVTCVGLAMQQCLLVRESQEDAWEFWYDGIEGFEHQAGTSYVLRIVETEVPNPPQDASSIKWELIEILKTS